MTEISNPHEITRRLLATRIVLICVLLASAPLFGACDEDEVEEISVADQQGDDDSSDRDTTYDERSTVVVASADITAETPLSEDLISTRDIPEQYLPANPLLDADVQIYLDMPLTTDVSEGDLIQTTDFAVAEARNLSSRIPEGERAVPITFASGASITDRVQTGDRIDILASFDVHDGAVDGGPTGVVTMSVLQNVTVLAPGAGPSADGDAARELTLGLTPRETELLNVAAAGGRLTFALRNRQDMETLPVKRHTLRGILEDLDVIQRKRTEVIAEDAPAPCAPDERRNARGECVPHIDITR